MKKDDVKAVAALGKVGEKLLQDHVIYDNPGKTTEEHLRKHLVDKLSAGENLDSDQVRFLMDTKPQENLKTQKLNPADQRIIEEKIKKAKGPSATEMWEIYKKTSTGRERAEFKKIEREYNKKNIIKPFYKQPTLKDKPTRKPDALPPGTETVKMQKETEPPFDLAKYIKEEAEKKLKKQKGRQQQKCGLSFKVGCL